jgi:1-phosphofructokinase family hexose kinase
MFLTVCLNPTIQNTFLLHTLNINQVNRCNNNFRDIGGKGVHTARTLAQLGQDTIHLTQLGGSLCDFFLKQVKQEEFQLHWIESNSEIRFCHTIIQDDDHTSTEIVEAGSPVDASTEKQILHAYKELVNKVDTIIISGTKAPGFSEKIFPEMVKFAREKNKFVTLDFRGKDLINCLQYSPDIIKPNLSEFANTFLPDKQWKENEIEKDEIKVINNTMLKLANKYQTTIVVTNGSKQIFYTQGNQIKELLPEPITPINTIGSGDVFTASLTYHYIKTNDIEKSLSAASADAKTNALHIRPGRIH